MLNSLKVQVSAALLLLLALFAGATGYTSQSLMHQRDNDMILELAQRLQLTAQYLANQAMRYKQHAPRDYSSYYRDLELYYQDLLAHVATFDRISDAFMHQDFDTTVTGLVGTLNPKLGEAVMVVINRVEDAWRDYRSGLFEALGTAEGEPRLEWGAEYVIAHNAELEQITGELTERLKLWTAAELRHIERINQAVMLTSAAITLTVVVWLFLKVLGPLQRTLQGFRRVTRGDFGYQVREEGSRETVQLTRAFNRLSGRLNILFHLIERLQAGSDLEQTLAFVSRELQPLLRVDWIGVLFVTGDGQAAKLEAAFTDGQPEAAATPLFRLPGTLLERALKQGAPLHIADMERTAAGNPGYQFLRALVSRGLKDAIFLPLTEESQSPLPGVLVFAARQPDSYDPEHLHLLNNIAELITHSFGRTVKLAEHARLAAVGGFASGIAHELRSPLATIGLALDHLDTLDLPPSSAKRTTLARREADRMGRLLEDMLLYARPLSLKMESLDLRQLLTELIEQHQPMAAARDQRLVFLERSGESWVMGDRDRITQVWLNLTRNACDAAPDGSQIDWSLDALPERGLLALEVRNDGEPIPAERVPRLGEPFFTTKPGGTGLGLAIVKRMADAHGGELRIRSDPETGTRIAVLLPRMGA